MVTMVTQEGAEAHGAAGCEVHTDDVIPLFQSILTFVSVGHIDSMTVSKQES